MQNVYQIDLFNRTKNPFTSEYKIYHDGSHYIARESVKGLKRRARKRERSELVTLFDFLFDEAIKSDIATDEEKKQYIEDKFINDYCIELPDIKDFIEENFARKMRNIWQREKRFRRKAYLNRWNFFVTFTYFWAIILAIDNWSIVLGFGTPLTIVLFLICFACFVGSFIF